jgi:hypothetical protein
LIYTLLEFNVYISHREILGMNAWENQKEDGLNKGSFNRGRYMSLMMTVRFVLLVALEKIFTVQ